MEIVIGMPIEISRPMTGLFLISCCSMILTSCPSIIPNISDYCREKKHKKEAPPQVNFLNSLAAASGYPNYLWD
jgi:hypothetical protein